MIRAACQAKIREWRAKADEHRAHEPKFSNGSVYHNRVKSMHHATAGTLEACARELEAVVVLSPTPDPPALWQPRETAPDDGSPFLAYSEAFVDEDFNAEGIVEACFDGEGGFVGAVWNGQSDIWNTLPIEFTHWMRRPTPPPRPSNPKGPAS